MIIGYDFWEDPENAFFQTQASIGNTTSIELYNGIYDEVHIFNDINTATSSDKQEWGINTVLLAKFLENYEAGSVSINGLDITHIKINRRKVGEVVWQTIKIVPFEEIGNIYTTYDDTAASAEIYEYAIIPMSNDFEGAYSISDPFKVDYNGFFVQDLTHNYRLYYNFQMGDISTIIPSSTIEPLSGSKYPIVVYNGDIKYQRGSISCSIMVDPTKTKDVVAEKRLRTELMEFLCNKKPKILKGADGFMIIGVIIGEPKLSSFNNLLGLYNLKIDFIEIADASDINELVNNGLLEVE